MNNEEKALIYDQLIRENDRLQRENSKLKAEYVANIPPEIEKIIENNNKRIATIVGQVESLLR